MGRVTKHVRWMALLVLATAGCGPEEGSVRPEVRRLNGTACAPGSVPAFPGADQCVLDPASIPKYVQPLVIPPVMPPGSGWSPKYGIHAKADYNLAVRQFRQQILPGGIWNTVNGRSDSLPATTVWSFGKAEDPYDLTYTARRPANYAPVRHEQKTVTVEYPQGGRKY